MNDFYSPYENELRSSGAIEYPTVCGHYIKTAEDAQRVLMDALKAVKWFGGDEA